MDNRFYDLKYRDEVTKYIVDKRYVDLPISQN